MSKVISDLGITCSASSKFYVCDDKPSRFIGCCTSDPCATANGVCPDTDLESTSFDSDKWADIPPQACAASSDPQTLWYTCRDADPTYMGCCAVNACTTEGCPAEKVRAARLSDRADDAAIFLPDAIAAITATSTTSVTASTATATQTLGVNGNPPDEGMSKGATIGISVTAAIIGLAIIGALFYWVFKRLRLAGSNDDDVPDFPHDEPYYGTSPEPRDSKYGDSISIQLQSIYPDSSSPSLPQHEQHHEQQQQPPQYNNNQQYEHQAQPQPQDFAVTLTPDMGGIISELPATATATATITVSENGIQSGDAAGRHLVSIPSFSGLKIEESLVSMQTPPLPSSSPQHMPVFELEDSSASSSQRVSNQP
ncbi:hypothetical protein PT974_09688 [Cladobotryum mycophilum]|uniref:Mid2 domain-containing protein n=1 Tax=Cladobotryum mycophilum TaxID=491253 RepID=A0ABR0SGW6_9HYPO